MVTGSMSNSSAATATIANTRESPTLMFASNPHLSGDETEDDESPITHPSAASPSPYGPLGFAKNVQERELRNMKRASSISVLSGLGVRDPERVLESSTNSSSANSSTTQLSKEQTSTAAKSPSASSFAGKMRAFLGQRPPSELIATHLPAYFPYTQPKVLRRTLRQSVRLSSMVTVGKRGSTLSIVGQGLGEQLPSRFSSSTVGSHVGQRTSMSPSRASSISLPPPPVPEKSPPKTATGTDTVEETPRLSLSTSDGRTSELDHGEDGAERTDDEAENENESAESGPKTHLLPPVNFPSESFADSFNSVTSGVASSQSAVGGRSGPSPSISRTTSNASRRFSYMAELRARRDRSDTASMLTVDEITAEVENRRKSTAVSSLRSSESAEEETGTNAEVTEEPDTYLDTTEDLVAAAEEEDESDEDEDDTLDDGGYDVVDESTLAETDEDVEPVKATGGTLIYFLRR